VSFSSILLKTTCYSFHFISSFSVPATTSLKNLKTKVDQARKNCLYVDCAFWAGVTGENNADLLTMANNGVCGFKAMLNPQDSYPDFPHLTKEKLKSALEILEETGCTFAVNFVKNN
jgi:allantoinase